MNMLPLIDIQLDRGSATNQIPVWNDTTKRFVPSTTLTGITLGTPWTLAGNGSWTGGSTFNWSDDNKVVGIAANSITALMIQDLTGTYLAFDTSTPTIDFGNATNNPAFNFVGTGLATFGGNILIPDDGFVGAVGTTTLIQLDGSGGIVTVDGDLIADTLNSVYIETTATDNLSVGSVATLPTITTGDDNLAFGASAGNKIEDGTGNVCLGVRSGFSVVSGNGNMFIGTQSGQNATGSNNIGIGAGSVFDAATGNSNIGVGNNACRGISSTTKTFQFNVGIGESAGSRLDTGSNNVFIGLQAGEAVKAGTRNTFIGAISGRAMTSGGSNTFIGEASGLLSTGSSNIFVGKSAGRLQTTASNIFLLHNVTRSSAADELIQSLLYGVMSTTVADQLLRVNGTLEVGNATTGQNAIVTGNVRIGDTTPATEALEVLGIIEGYGGRKKNTTRLINTDSPYTVLSSDHEIFCDTDAGAITVNLPAGVNKTNYRIINTGSSGNDVTVVPNGAELLTGANASRTLSDSSVIILTYESTEGWW